MTQIVRKLDLEKLVSSKLPKVNANYQKSVIIKVEKDALIDYGVYNNIHVNMEVTDEFRENKRNIGLRVRKWVDRMIKQQSDKALVIDYYELLFEKSFQMNPIELFLNNSKNQTIIIIWRYEIRGRILTYSEPNHGDYLSQEINIQIPILGGK